MTEEIWRPVVGYEGLYEVSSYGRVRSLDRYDSRNRFCKGRILKLNDDGRGYLSVQLCSNNKIKKFLVHRVVAQAFISNPDNLPEVNHLDEDKTNNRVDNLEFCNHKYNINFGTRTDLMRDTKIKNGYWTGLSEKEYSKKYYRENKEKINERQREYNQKNKDKKREYWKKWHQEHKNEYNERKREYVKKYYLENRDKINERRRENRKKKAGL